MKLISRIYTDYNGAIFLDDVNLKNVSFESYYKNISVVFQDSYVFSGSIYDEILIMNNGSLVVHSSYEKLSTEIKNWIHAFPQK